MECFVIFVMAWCWCNATESKPQNVSGKSNRTQKTNQQNTFIWGYLEKYSENQNRKILKIILQQQLNTDRLLNQMVYGSDFKIYSQGEHIRQLNETIENQKRYIRELISKYSYTSNPKGLIGLGGGLS